MRTFFTIVFTLLVAPSFAHGWGGDGHQLTCLIAEDRLTPAAQAGIRSLIGNAYISDAENATWADEIRRDRTETGPWHFVDIPVDAAGYDAQRDGQNGNNVIDRITFYANVLKDKSAKRADRVEALKFVIHLVGDIHQPLHCAERNHDKGGNMRLVWFPGGDRATNLHSVWDSAILEQHMGNSRNLAYSDKLNAAITAQQAAAWAKGTPTDWANESHDIARTKVYAGIPVDGPPPQITPAYINASSKVIDEQLEKGGVRLAMVLNDAFK